jgi:superfamily II DNA or RNA helicase
MITKSGYSIEKSKVPNVVQVKKLLSVKPYIPSVFVKPQYVTSYKVFTETDTHLYVPKHFGIQTFGNVPEDKLPVKTGDAFWEFKGAIRDSQKEVVNSYLCPEPRDGIISLQTGGGKTVCALYIASKIGVPTIVLVHNTFLLDQWVDRISAFLPKARVGMIRGETANVVDKDIVVAMLQSVALKDYDKSVFEKFGMVIVDECHHIASEAFSRAIPKLTCKHMLGLSATPERKDKLMYVINWFLGPILYKSDAADKVDSGVKVEVYEFATPDEEFNTIIYNSSGVMFTSLMVNKLVLFEERNTFINQIIQDVFEDETRQFLVLTDRVEHTETLMKNLPSELQKNACILGRKVSSKDRAEFCESKRILIATYQMVKEGFDVAKLNTLVIATPRPDVEQIVGRILRVQKEERKSDPLIIDIVDGMFRRQFQERLSLYRKRNYCVEKMEIK